MNELPVGNVAHLTDAERRRVLVEWNQTARPYPKHATVHSLFAAQATERPDAVAAACGDCRATYRELDERSNAVAHELQRLGVRAGTLVAFCLERSIEAIVAMLGILKAGGTYVPLDPAYPKERLAFLMEDSRAEILLTQRALTDRLPEPTGKILWMESFGAEARRKSFVSPEQDGESLAYVIYTSGSQGRPKGVCVPHRAIHRLVRHTHPIQIEASDTVAQITNISFDPSIAEIWGALLNGARVVVLPTSVLLSADEFAREVRRHKINVAFIAAAVFSQFARHDPTMFRNMRYVVFGGEAADLKSVQLVLDHGAPRFLINAYGPTETTTYVTCHVMKRPGDAGNALPIGRPIANAEIYILDERLQPVPVGEEGELHVGGDALAHGYLRQPQLTAERFIPHPFSAVPGARLYKTGDLARYRPDGNIEFRGRIDEQVKIRGYRIEPGEIETMLAQHPAVREAAARVHTDGNGDKQIVGYVVPADIKTFSEEDARRFLAAKLPSYMVPSAIVPLASMPLTVHGKVDRKSLPPPDSRSRRSREPILAPRTPVEKAIARVWTQLLGVAAIGVHDNFFDLGGHSLLATQAIARIQQELQVELSVGAIFEAPTLESLARAIDPLLRAAPPDIEALLKQMENMSDEEAARLLAAENNAPA